ncbi:hypothetical protein GCM10027269_84400 [Kribbella endophytica]
MAALQRARQRQARIEAATGRAVRARAALERANRSRELAIERHNEKVIGAQAASIREAADLAKVCGSTEAAAEILGLSLREMRRLLKSDVPETSARPKQVSPRSGRRDADSTDRGGGDGPLES